MATGTIIALIASGLLLVFCEVFVPGGVLGALGGIAIVIGLVAAFMADPTLGLGLLLGTLVFGLFGFWLWMTYFPRSPLGRKMILGNDGRDWHGFDALNRDLVGMEGVAHTTLRPAGTAIIEGKRVDVVTRGDMIDAGARIKVIQVEGNRIIVTAA